MLNRLISGVSSICIIANLLAGFPDLQIHAEMLGGACGDSAYWTYADGTLTISGAGSIPSFYVIFNSDGSVHTAKIPWYEIRNDIRTVVVEDSITKIGAYSFLFCENLEELLVTAPVTAVGAYACKGCTNLTELTLPDSATGISSSAFSDCPNVLTKVDGMEILNGRFLVKGKNLASNLILPEGITTICDNALSNCSFRSVQFPNSLQFIGNEAFYSCLNLIALYVSNSVQFIGANAFMGCERLFEKLYDENGLAVLDGTYLVGCSDGVRTAQIPNGTTIIADAVWKSEAIRGNTDLFEVNCPETLQAIGAEAFYNCQNLMFLNLNDGLERIGENALTKCYSLRSLTIPASVTEIGAQAECLLKEIYGTPGTAAEQFARENGIAFYDAAELANPPQNGRDLTLDYAADGWYFGNSSDVFGSEYYLTDADRQRLIELGFNPKDADTAWSGSCIGLSVTVILAKNGVFSPAMLQSGAQSLAALEPSEAVQSFINYFQCIQGRGGASQSWESAQQKIYRLQAITKNVKNGASPCLLTFSLPSGSHGVVAYAQESGSWTFDDISYDARILVWDSNYPTALHDESCLYYDTETFAYCIPQYSVGDNAEGSIISICNDLNVLNAYPYPLGLRGDADGDGEISAADAQITLIWAAEIMVGNKPEITPAQRAAVDIDGDGEITALDSQHILNYYAQATLAGNACTWEDILSGNF